MWPCVSLLASSSSCCCLAIARAREASLCQRGEDVTSRHASPPPRLAFLDPSAASPLLRLPPCRPCHASAPSFRFRLLPCPLSSSRLLRNLAAHLLVARPLARFPVPAFFILRAGRVLWRSVAFLDQRKKERGKKKRAFYLAAAGG
ncbi:hypothetical protein PVAP13_3KG564550 [Panicum virgatum]|uniref:Secreted protein n=1 Tax=Panicum virgatum TaxID=38727 RepID=A0A8T0VCC9_PANVG|nr:hypothetical protein PVAP13_3KG564550 [Panicum virgatum]